MDDGYGRAIPLITSFPLHHHQTRMLKVLQVERKAVVRVAQAFGNVSRNKTLRLLFHQETENLQAHGARKRLKPRNDGEEIRGRVHGLIL